MSRIGETIVVIACLFVIAGVVVYVKQHVTCVNLPYVSGCLFK